MDIFSCFSFVLFFRQEGEGYGIEGGYLGWFGNVRGVYILVSYM